MPYNWEWCDNCGVSVYDLLNEINPCAVCFVAFNKILATDYTSGVFNPLHMMVNVAHCDDFRQITALL